MKTTDYVNPADGLLYCGKCHTPRQCRVTAFSRETVQYCICKCEQKRLDEEKAWFEEQKRRQAKSAKRRNTNAKTVDLFLELDGGGQGHIKGTIS